MYTLLTPKEYPFVYPIKEEVEYNDDLTHLHHYYGEESLWGMENEPYTPFTLVEHTSPTTPCEIFSPEDFDKKKESTEDTQEEENSSDEGGVSCEELPFVNRLEMIIWRNRRRTHKDWENQTIGQFIYTLSWQDLWVFESYDQFESLLERTATECGFKNWSTALEAVSTPKLKKRLREIRRRINNRISAKKSRKRRADELDRLVQDNKRLRQKVASLERQVDFLSGK